MDVNPQQIAKMIKDLLGHPGTESNIRNQMYELARKNIHLQGVVEAVVDAVAQLKDSEARKQGWQFVMSLEDARFASVHSVYARLVEVLKNEKDRAFRSSLLQRLTRGLHLDPQIGNLMVSLMVDPLVNEEERTQIMKALSNMPSTTEDMAVAALERAQKSSLPMQLWAIELAVGVTKWSEKLVTQMTPYLQPQMPAAVREKVWSVLTEARRLGPALTPTLIDVLRLEANPAMRFQALEILSKIRNDNGVVFTQIVWTAQNDREADIRARATELQRQHPQITAEQVRFIAQRLFEEPSAIGRLALLEAIKPWIREADIRKTLGEAFASSQLSELNDSEFTEMVAMLFPYVTREQDVKEALLKAAEREPSTLRRTQLLEKLIQTLKIDSILPWVASRFVNERDPALREVLFNKLSALSVSKHEPLIEVFASELKEPSSAFRVRCASVLAPVIETHPAVVAAFEDVLLHDQDRELIRTATEAYLKPLVAQKFSVLLEIVKNESLDPSTRKIVLEKLSQIKLTEAEQQQLTDSLNSARTKI